MTYISIEEHLESMTGEVPQPWLIELGQMLRELQELDSALAASLAFDLSRDPATARALRELLHGSQVIEEVLSTSRLTTIQSQTIQQALAKISEKLLLLSAAESISGHRTPLAIKEK